MVVQQISEVRDQRSPRGSQARRCFTGRRICRRTHRQSMTGPGPTHGARRRDSARRNGPLRDRQPEFFRTSVPRQYGKTPVPPRRPSPLPVLSDTPTGSSTSGGAPIHAQVRWGRISSCMDSFDYNERRRGGGSVSMREWVWNDHVGTFVSQTARGAAGVSPGNARVGQAGSSRSL